MQRIDQTQQVPTANEDGSNGPQLKSESSTLQLILDAASFAAHKHRTQRRKDHDASPYINHPLALARTLAQTAGVTDQTVLCAALLHDTVEDTDTTFEELEQRFGAKITSVVREVTDDKDIPKEDRKRLQVEKAGGKSREAKLVKLADKISNLRDILSNPPVDWPRERKVEYFEWAAKVVAGARGTNQALEEEFDRVFALGMQVFDETAN